MMTSCLCKNSIWNIYLSRNYNTNMCKCQKKNENVDLNNNFLRFVFRLLRTCNHRSRLIDNKSIIRLDHREYLIIWHEAMIIYAFAHLETFFFVKYNHAMIRWFFFDCWMNLIQIRFLYKKIYSLSWIQS